MTPATRKRDAAGTTSSGADLFKDVVAYTAIGEHRTATRGDLKTSAWISNRLREQGFDTRFQPFSIGQFFINRTELRIRSTTLRCFPLWPPRETGRRPVEGQLAPADVGERTGRVRGRIALMKLPFDGHAPVRGNSVLASKVSSLIKAGAAAVLIVTEGPTGEIVAHNYDGGLERWAVPVVLVAPHDLPVLERALAGKAEVSLLADGRYESQAPSRNVIGTLDPTPRGDSPAPASGGRSGSIVVSTPLTGWFRCGGERGPGVALFLALAKWVALRRPEVEYVFVGTAAHEFDNRGMRLLMESEALPPDGVRCWVHLGAGIATWAWCESPSGLSRLRHADSNRYVMCSSDFAPLLGRTFASLEGLTPITTEAVGEMWLVKRKGYRGFGIAAGHRYHHTPVDDASMTAATLLEPVAEALVSTLSAVENEATS